MNSHSSSKVRPIFCAWIIFLLWRFPATCFHCISCRILDFFYILLILYLQRMFYLKLRCAEPSQSICFGSTNGSRPYAVRCKNNTPPPHPLFRLRQGAAGSRRASSPVWAVSPARLCAEGALLNVRSLSFRAWQDRITMSFLTRNSLSIREVSRNMFI